MNPNQQTDDAVVRFQGVSLGYGRGTVLRDLTFSINEGDFLGIIGPNGSGKTTILRAILRVIKPMRGSIHVREELRFGYVMQRQALDEIFPLSVLDVVSMGRLKRVGVLRRFSKEDTKMIERALSITGIEELRGKRYRDLSGGQKQRVLVARALAFEPEVLLLDEPTNDLDIRGEEQVLTLIRDIHLSMGITIVLVSHLLNVVFGYVHRVMFLKDKRMRIYHREEALRPQLLSEIYETPVKVGDVDGRCVIVPEGKSNAAS
jgi:ABC-type cobalamin/Fe3+-siderophores transport system ATPase subunit